MWTFELEGRVFTSEKETQYDAAMDILGQLNAQSIHAFTQFQVLADLKYVDTDKYDPMDSGD